MVKTQEKVKHHELAKAYLGDIAYAEGNGEEALKLWQECIDDASDAWRPYAHRADQMVHMGRYDDALHDYTAWLEKQSAPHYTDPCICMALLYEEKGEIGRAIKMREEQCRILREEYSIDTGDEYERILLEINRLKAMQSVN